jgi:hypothetical protein
MLHCDTAEPISDLALRLHQRIDWRFNPFGRYFLLDSRPWLRTRICSSVRGYKDCGESLMLKRLATTHIDALFMTGALGVSILAYIVLFTNISNVLR